MTPFKIIKKLKKAQGILEMEEKHLYTSEEKLKWWGYGEWVEEPDEVLFEHEGIKCKIIRICLCDGPGTLPDGTYLMFGGYLCGYIFVPKDNPNFGILYEDIEMDVHCGLSYSRMQDDGYWIGFDCAHSGDLVPSNVVLKKLFHVDYLIPEGFENHHLFNPTYKNMNFCIQECKSMAEQIRKAEAKHE